MWKPSRLGCYGSRRALKGTAVVVWRKQQKGEGRMTIRAPAQSTAPFLSQAAPRAMLLAVACLSVATCDLYVTVGSLGASSSSRTGAPDAGVLDAAVPDADASDDSGQEGGLAFPLPFATGFEGADGGCTLSDFSLPIGACYTVSGGMNSVTTSPAHRGACAGAFTTVGDAGCVARCFLQGNLTAPVAWFIAWFYIPSPPPPIHTLAGSSSWNVMHFQGPDEGGETGLVDVNFAYQPDGSLLPALFAPISGGVTTTWTPAALPLDKWFKVSLRVARSSTAAGGVWTLYQDGALAIELSGVVTEPGPFLQFHVGNLTAEITVPTATLYADDISVSTSGP